MEIHKNKCSKCGGSDDRTERQGQKYCLPCHAAYMRENRPAYRDLSDEQRKKNCARSYANVYRRRGKLEQKPCEDCGSEKSQMHHEDYDKPLDVTWLCRRCHLDRHEEAA